MQPLPEVSAAAERLSAITGDVDLLQGLEILAQVAATLIPSTVGVSLTIVVDGDPLTVTATSEDVAALDATQYLDGGPCVDSAGESHPLVVGDVLDEERWQLYARAARASGVRSSLSLPLGGAAGQTPGAINLYASQPHAFRGKENLIAEVFQTPLDAFVTNADLSFTTRDAARALPEQLEERAKVDQAIGMLTQLLRCSTDEARDRLRRAAAQAGAPVTTVADMVVALSAA